MKEEYAIGAFALAGLGLLYLTGKTVAEGAADVVDVVPDTVTATATGVDTIVDSVAEAPGKIVKGVITDPIGSAADWIRETAGGALDWLTENGYL